MRTVIASAVVLVTVGFSSTMPVHSQEASKPVSDRQVAVMMFVDYGRSYGYQSMLAAIQLDVVKAQIERDTVLLKQKQELYTKRAIPLVELEIAQLKDLWNRKQLVVAEKSLATVSAQYEAMTEMAKHFGGVAVPTDALYGLFRRAWDAGCAEGPDEVEAMKAWTEFATKSVERARQLHRRGRESTASLLDKELQQRIAQANYEQRASRLDRCRSTLFPEFKDILAIDATP